MEQHPAVPARAVAIVLPAMGTVASFYRLFAKELAGRGFSVLLPELPGTGASHPKPSWKVDYGYRDLINVYLPAIVNRANEIGQGSPVILIGHSLGAHAGVLAAATGSISVDALVTIAGGNIHFRNWKGADAGKVFLAGALFSLSTRLFGFMPGQYFGFGGPQARTLIREWAKVIRAGHFSHIVGEADFSAGTPLLALGFEGDTLAPEKSVAALAQILKGRVEILQAGGKGSAHNAWARNPAETCELIEGWLSEGIL